MYLNEVIVGGNITKVMRSEKTKTIRVEFEAPLGREDNERDAGKTTKLAVDITNETQSAAMANAKPGDFFACQAQLVNKKIKPDDKEQMYNIRWLDAVKDTLITLIPDGGSHMAAAFNRIIIQGRCTRVSDLKTTGNNKSMCFVTVSWLPQLPKNATDDEKKFATVHVDAAFFGGTAEKYILPYLKEYDIINIVGHLGMSEEKFTSNGKKVSSIRVNAHDAKFMTPEGKKQDNGKKTFDKKAVEKNFDDDDLPF